VKYTDIINDAGFQCFVEKHTSIDFTNDVHQCQDTRIYFALHKTREAINNNLGDIKISVDWNYVEVLHFRKQPETIRTKFVYYDYNNQEIEALAAALYFIYKEQK